VDNSSVEPLVVVRDVTKEFRRDSFVIPVLAGINLTLAQGDYMALMGPSGSGKSTLLNLIAGLDRPTSGDVVVCGTNIGKTAEGALAKWRANHIGFIFQMYNLIPVLTAYENVELPLTLTGLSSRERDQHVKTALEVVGLGDRMDHYPRQLSGGQEQ
jgi:putative ABC transport system ATP-binding protein